MVAQNELKIEQLVKQAVGRWSVAQYFSPDEEINLRTAEIYEKVLNF